MAPSQNSVAIALPAETDHKLERFTKMATAVFGRFEPIASQEFFVLLHPSNNGTVAACTEDDPTTRAVPHRAAHTVTSLRAVCRTVLPAWVGLMPSRNPP